MIWTTQAILDVLTQERKNLRNYGVRRLGLFGSHARGEAGEHSDLDFVVEFEKKSFDAYMDLREFLEKRFDRPIDLVIADTVKPALRGAIVEKTIYASGL